MSITTKDRVKVGQTTYRAGGSRWDHQREDEVDVDGCGGEYQSLPAVKLAARSWMPKGATQIHITRGTYEAQDIADHEYGVVRHANWAQDEQWVCHGWVSDGRIDWEEESW